MGRADDLRRWVDAGLIDDATAEAIEAYESDRAGSGRVGRGMEAVAYLGSVLILVAVGILLSEFWDRIEPWGQLALAVLATGVLVGLGVLSARSSEPAMRRAQSFAWFVSIAAVGLTAQVVVDEFVGMGNRETFIVVSLPSLVAAVVLWRLRQSVLQIVAMGITSALSVVAGVALFESAPDYAFGLSIAGLGLIWMLLTWAGLLTPVRTSYALAGIGMLLVAFPEGNDMPWPLLGLGVGLALMAASVRLNEGVLLGLGVVGLFVYIPLTIFELFGESLGVPVALLITGFVLVGVVVVSIRVRRATEP